MNSNREFNDNIVVSSKSPKKPDKKASWEHVRKLFEGMTLTDEDVAKAREERLR